MVDPVVVTYDQADRVHLPLRQLNLDLSGGGTKELVALQANVQIQVLKLVLSTANAASFSFRSGSDVVAVFRLADNSTIVWQTANDESPCFWGSLGENLDVVVSGSPSASCYLQYRPRVRALT